jgi:hypothetical protein
MAGTKCLICDAPMPGDWTEYPQYPFCTKRCKLIDLGRPPPRFLNAERRHHGGVMFVIAGGGGESCVRKCCERE